MRISPEHRRRLILIIKYGFDGSSGQSNYKQIFIDKNGVEHQDSSIMTTAFVALQLIYVDSLTGKRVVLWQALAFLHQITADHYDCSI